MPDIFITDSHDAISMQKHYEQVIQVLLNALLDTKQDVKEGLKIFDGDKLVYGQQNHKFHDEVSGLSGQLLNPQLFAQLQQLRSTPVGEVVEGAIDKRLELDGKVVLQSDNNGKVIVNELLQPEIVKDIKQEELKEFNQPNTLNNGYQIIYPEFTSLQNGFNSNPTWQSVDDEIPSVDNTSKTLGSRRVAESVSVLDNNPLKALLSTEIKQLQSEIQALQQEHQLYKELIEQRLQQPKNTSWWQQLTNNASTVIASLTNTVKIGIREFQENSTQHQFAISIKNLFHLQTQPGDSQYQAGYYHISRNGSLYEIKESATNKQIMQFRSTPLGLRVERSDLFSNHIRDFTTLQNSLQQNQTIPASFAPVGKQEAEHFVRVERIISTLVNYANLQQKEVEIDGAFSYKWRANPNGDVNIEAKDGRGKLLEKSNGNLTSNMSNRDLVYFEQILHKLQPNSTKETSKFQSHSASNSIER